MKYDKKSSHTLPAQVTYSLLSIMISYANTIATMIFFNKIMKKLSFFDNRDEDSKKSSLA